MKKIWKENEESKELKDRAEYIKERFKLKSLPAKLIAKKDLKTDEQIEAFLRPKRENFYDPFLMPDMKKAVKRILKAIENKEKIVIYGDYDADGITSTSILKRFMKDRGIEVGTYIPNRLDEGYGLNEDAINKIHEEGYNLIITVDCGITATQETELVKSLGMDIIITDHHEPGEEIPDAVAVIDCKRKDNKYPFRELAGCGVAFKLTQAIAKELKISEDESLKYLDIVCVGTISDIVPLVDENRIIAKLGLLLLRQTRNVGLRELIKICKFKELNSSAVSFGISPRINACGRMGHQEDALELFLTDDPRKAGELAEKLEKYNRERQEIEKRIFSEATEMIKKEKMDENKCIVLGKEDWHHGVIGIVSSKITETYYKPSILLCFEEEYSRGSGRSVAGFDLHEAISKCSENLTNFGGHSMAIGLALKTDNYDKFKKDFEKYVSDNLDSKISIPELKIDNEITNKNIDVEEIEQLKLLEPFGEANQEPIVEYKNLKIIGIRTLTEGKHLKLTLNDENVVINAIGFNLGELASEYQIGDKIDVAGNIEINEFNTLKSVQMVIKDLRKSIKK